MKNVLFGVAALLMAAMVLAGCSESSALVGKWHSKENDLELSKDGTGILDKAGFTWKTENGRFYFNFTSSVDPSAVSSLN
jgi:hypothetical protein